ncbi:PAS domain-containing sensor histidine kinase [Methylocystis bryophila]|nr:PAS domain S-box protein [Methylocystis bryophila]BDV37188.1 hypothetical protein DSM21852_04410 [Methylocystis bryophila]
MPYPYEARRIFEQIFSAPNSTRRPSVAATSIAPSPVQSLFQRLAIGVGAAVLGLAFRLAIQDFVGNRIAYLTFYPVVMGGALLGGSVSGLVAALLCAAVAQLWLFPVTQTGDWIELPIFLAGAAVISGASEALRNAMSRTDSAEERADVEDRFRIVNERLRLAMSAGAIGAWDFDTEGNVFDACPQMREIFGFASDTLVTRDALFDAVVAQDRSAATEAFRAALDPMHGGRYFAQYRIRRVDDNAERWVGSQAQALFVEGKPARLIGVSRDITHEKGVEGLLHEKAQLADQLKESERRLRVFYDSGLVGVMCWNVDGSITEANDKFLEMLGYSREDLSDGRIDWIKITPPEFLPREQAAMAEVRASGATKEPFEQEYIRQNGERLPVLTAVSTLDGAGAKGVALALDISDRKRAEAELQKLHIHRFDLMKSMAAGFAHEITQPLTAAGAYAAAARRMLSSGSTGRAAEVVAETLEKTAGEVTRAGRIISRLREFISHGETNLLPAHLHDLIRQALADSGVVADDKSKVKLQLNAARDEVLADKVQLALVLVNLIRNAMQAMATSAKSELIIATSCDDQQIRVDVSDKGQGVSPELRDSLFEPFTTTKAGGMGIGLSISRAIIEAHHGSIWSKPSLDCGTIVSFALPLLDTENCERIAAQQTGLVRSSR